jgi:hypothetical protein
MANISPSGFWGLYSELLILPTQGGEQPQTHCSVLGEAHISPDLCGLNYHTDRLRIHRLAARSTEAFASRKRLSADETEARRID